MHLSQLLTYIFVGIMYLFIFVIVQMISRDIRVMYRKKTGEFIGAYLKLINLRNELSYAVEESYELSDDEIIGRGKKCTITISDKYLSAKNSRIFCLDNKYYVADLESTNGTFLNGERLGEDAVELFDGDKISLGRTNFLFVLSKKQNR